VEVDLGDLAAPKPEAQARQTITHYRQELEGKPDDPLACNNLAWAYLTAPAALRDAKSALPLAEKAVALARGNGVYRNTLGLAYYRLGRYREAVDTLRPNLRGQEDGCLAFDLYILAMSHHRLGEAATARVYYDWADRRAQIPKELPPQQLQELSAFRAEAAELLGVKEDEGKLKDTKAPGGEKPGDGGQKPKAAGAVPPPS
jgi:tetratricopeptide (TPR) repeat protein